MCRAGILRSCCSFICFRTLNVCSSAVLYVVNSFLKMLKNEKRGAIMVILIFIVVSGK